MAAHRAVRGYMLYVRALAERVGGQRCVGSAERARAASNNVHATKLLADCIVAEVATWSWCGRLCVCVKKSCGCCRGCA